MDLDINLLNQVRRLQRAYLTYMSKADEIHRKVGKGTTAECQFLQAAANQKSELIRITQGSGAEMISHMNDMESLNRRIDLLRDELEPGRAAAKRAAAEAAANAANTPADSESSENNTGAPKQPDKKTNDDDDDIDTSGWYAEMPKHSLDGVSGMESVKTKLRTCMVETELQRLASRLKMQVLNSFFFVGPPGCGKTFIIKGFVHDLMQKRNYKYLYLDCSQIITKYVGDSEKIVKKLFEEAVAAAPCILFIDEIDGMCKNRSNPSLPEYASSLTTAFLTSYNIINESDKEIIFIGATNYPRNVDEAMLDRVEVVYVGLPDEEARRKAFETAFAPDEGDEFTSLICFEPGLDAEYMAKRTRSYNYRDIKRVIENIKKSVFNSLAERLRENSDKYKADEYVDMMIKELNTGKYVLTKETFDSVLKSFSPSNKNKIINDIKEWMEEVRADDESSGLSSFPDLEGHPDFSEDAISGGEEIMALINGVEDKLNDIKGDSEESEEQVEEAEDTSVNEDDTEEDTEEKTDEDTDEEPVVITKENVKDAVHEAAEEIAEEAAEALAEAAGEMQKEAEETEKKSAIILCEEEFTLDPDGQVTVSFFVDREHNSRIIAWIDGEVYKCTEDADGSFYFSFVPKEGEDTAVMTVMDSAVSLGETEIVINRGISENVVFGDIL